MRPPWQVPKQRSWAQHRAPATCATPRGFKHLQGGSVVTVSNSQERDRAEVGSSYGQHSGGGAGRKFVTHAGGFDWHFAMRSEKWMPLMNTLRDDVSAQLVSNGAQILSQSGDPRDGFSFQYKLGKSIGTLRISPLATDSLIHRATPLCKGLVDVTVRIEQTETWFPAPEPIADPLRYRVKQAGKWLREIAEPT